MFRAFLSHSSIDKEFVRAVASELGRQFCLFDEQVFENGEEFKRSIEKMLDDSAVFVLFATEGSLKRMWVEFEIDEAWYRTLEGKIGKSLVFILDSAVEIKSLPSWLGRAKISRINVPKLVAREIRQHLDDLTRIEQRPHFEGRNDDLERLQRLLTPIGEIAPRIVGVHGLPSVGKRTFLSKACQLTLSFSRTLQIPVSDGDGLFDIAIKVANLLEPFSTKEGFDAIVKTIRAEAEDVLLVRVIRNFKFATTNRELPILFDDGGMFAPDGSFSDSIRRLIRIAEGHEDLYLFVVSSRKPPADTPSLPLRPLNEEHTRRLIAKIATSERVQMTASQITEIAEYVNGYPPAAYYAVDQAKSYGVQSVIADKTRLVQFRSSAFVKYLKAKELTLDQRSILLVLARYSPMPLSVLGESVGMDVSRLLSNVMVLIDHSLIVPNETGFYEIAGPISDAVVSEFQAESNLDHELIYGALSKLLQSDDEELPRLQLYRLLFKASIRTGSHDSEVFHMTSDLIKLAEDFYHRREYRECVETARVAVQELPSSITARDYLIRALIQDGQWDIAEAEIEQFKKFAPMRDVHFLRGFSHRKQGATRKALFSFLEAEKLGRAGVASKREIANCYFLLDELAQAKKYVQEAIAIRENRFVLDLLIQIATREGDEKAARTGLKRLEAIDTVSFVQHRLSTVELRFGSAKEALRASTSAVEAVEGGRPPFGMLAQLTTCLTREKKYDEAEAAIFRIAKMYGSQKTDIRNGLACRLEIERGNFSKAIEYIERISDQKSPVYKAMKKDALSGFLSSTAISDVRRQELNSELDELNKQLREVDVSGAWLTLVQ